MWRMFLWLFLINMYTVAVAISCLESISHDCNHRKVSHSPESQEPEAEAAESRQNDRGLQRFLIPSNRDSNAPQIDHNQEGQDGRSEAKNRTVGTRPDDTTFTNRKGRLVVTGEQQRQSCSCKMHRNVLRIHCMVILSVSLEDEQHTRSDDSRGSVASLKSTTETTALSCEARQARAVEFSGSPRATAQNKALRAPRESKKAENQKRQFTTEDFRNLFSYSRHGKYKQVISRVRLFSRVMLAIHIILSPSRHINAIHLSSF